MKKRTNTPARDLAETSLKALLKKVCCSLESKQLIEIISNIDNREINSALVKHGLHFDHVITSELCKAYKPRKEVFEKALELLNMKPGEVLHVGDSYAIDVLGAKAVGIPVVWVNKNKKRLTTNDMTPDYVVGDLRGLLDILRRTSRRGKGMAGVKALPPNVAG